MANLRKKLVLLEGKQAARHESKKRIEGEIEEMLDELAKSEAMKADFEEELV